LLTIYADGHRLRAGIKGMSASALAAVIELNRIVLSPSIDTHA
jgi:hypothetical protein